MKKILTFSLALLMVLSIFILIPPVEAEAATTYDFLFPVNKGEVKIAYYYGYTSDYFDGTVFHTGIDIHPNSNTIPNKIIYAAFSGTVTETHDSCFHVSCGYKCEHYNEYGNSIRIKGANGEIAIYGHLKQYSLMVSKGEYVEKGTPIAIMGSSGWSTGTHLHFEVRVNGSNINVNPTNASKNPGLAVYSTSGYKPVVSDTIAEDEYQFNNDGYRMYMISDKSARETIGASTSIINDSSVFKVIKDGNYYRILPKTGGANYLNAYWTTGGAVVDGDEITLYTNDTSDYSQKWIFEKCGDGYLIHPACTPGLAITREDSKIVVKQTTGAANQIWKLEGDCTHTYSYCYNDDTHWEECTLCGDKKTAESHRFEYNYGETGSQTSPDSANPSTEHWEECVDCGYTKNYSTHNWVLSYTFEGFHRFKCTECYEMYTEYHTYSNGCDTVCDVCEFDERNDITHTYDNGCDTDCNVCGEIRTVTHSYDEYNGDVNNHWKMCSVCGEAGSTPEPHVPVYITIVSSTHHTWICAVCNINAFGTHLYTNDCDPTCDLCAYTREISHQYTHGCDTDCNVCGETRKTKHNYTEWYETKAPTCTESGIEERKCSVCGYAEMREINALDHSYGNWYETTSPTCTEAGTEKRKCSVCEYAEVRETEALGHTSAEAVVENKVDTTCTESGSYDSVVYCSVCNAELSREMLNIEPLGHDYSDEWTVDLEPTCTASGRKSHHCSRCDSKADVTKIPAGNHDYEATVTKPNCTTDGYTTYICSICDDTYFTDVTVATGHIKTTTAGKEATCTEPGFTSSSKCLVCEEILVAKTEIPAKGHDYDANVIAPTCEDNGYTVYTCACGDTYEADEVEALGHDWIDATEQAPKTCDKCGKTEGEKLPETDLPSNETPVEKNHDECKESGWKRFWNAIGNFFRSLFGGKKKCICGDEI